MVAVSVTNGYSFNMSEKERKETKRQKALIGDIFDLIRGKNDFTNSKMFTQKHPDIQIDYNTLNIRINKQYSIQLIKTIES